MAKSHHPNVTVQPSLFDIFYEEFLTQFMSASPDPTEISADFMKLKTDLERAEFLLRLPFIRDFEIKNKAGLKCIEKAVKYREEGNKLFQVGKYFRKYLEIFGKYFDGLERPVHPGHPVLQQVHLLLPPPHLRAVPPGGRAAARAGEGEGGPVR